MLSGKVVRHKGLAWLLELDPCGSSRAFDLFYCYKKCTGFGEIIGRVGRGGMWLEMSGLVLVGGWGGVDRWEGCLSGPIQE
jgi:hypothetical protein